MDWCYTEVVKARLGFRREPSEELPKTFRNPVHFVQAGTDIGDGY